MFLLLCAGTEAGKAPCLPCWGSSHRSAAALEQLQIYGLAAAKHRVDEKLCWEVGKEGVICLPSWVQGSSLGSATMSGQEGSTNPWSSCCLPGRWGWVRVLLTECSQKRLLCFFHILYHLEVVCGGAERGLKGSQLGAGMCGVSTARHRHCRIQYSCRKVLGRNHSMWKEEKHSLSSKSLFSRRDGQLSQQPKHGLKQLIHKKTKPSSYLYSLIRVFPYCYILIY